MAQQFRGLVLGQKLGSDVAPQGCL